MFTEDAVTDYSVAGAPKGSYRELALWMRGDATKPGSMSGFSAWQHMLSLPIVTLSGDSATARTDFFATHRGRPGKAGNVHYNAAGAFHDELVRTPARLAHSRAPARGLLRGPSRDRRVSRQRRLMGAKSPSVKIDQTSR